MEGGHHDLESLLQKMAKELFFISLKLEKYNRTVKDSNLGGRLFVWKSAAQNNRSQATINFSLSYRIINLPVWKTLNLPVRRLWLSFCSITQTLNCLKKEEKWRLKTLLDIKQSLNWFHRGVLRWETGLLFWVLTLRHSFECWKIDTNWQKLINS